MPRHGMTMKCILCGESGHNKRACGLKNNPGFVLNFLIQLQKKPGKLRRPKRPNVDTCISLAKKSSNVVEVPTQESTQGATSTCSNRRTSSMNESERKKYEIEMR
ncbi:hypothetical protein Scep_004507 [Stephania cephalantha]|uniref:CCHC-type domain-containing protein n=1 Tax=Stephania cephalantha TaxID=152367 RepID=A0AAP0KSL3_9MAGN